MRNFEHEKYDPCKKWMQSALDSGESWEYIETLGASQNDAERILRSFCDDDWPENMDINEWQELVVYQKKKWLSFNVIDKNPIAGLERYPGDASVIPLSGTASTWQSYKKKISENLSDESVVEIEKSCKWILSHLKLDTRGHDNIKGLVMGSVQSGKTANMCGLVSMAADLDWNIFIVLSGTIDNLRIQTRDRFRKDLQDSEGIVWNVIDFAGEDKHFAAESLKLNSLDLKPFNRRYLTVCLKQRKRLESLIDWLYSDENMTHKMRIIVIDDEADQASINTAKILSPEEDEDEQERRAINQLIVNLVNGRRSDGSTAKSRFQSMNYISYTATPYANILNETPGQSLYPSDFICSLEEAKEYFGPRIIFGNDEDDDSPGLDIIRDIPKEELTWLKNINKGTVNEIPEEMKRSVAWFLCSSAILRMQKYSKPVSMLIHTSSKLNNHFNIYELLSVWLRNKKEVIHTCETVYSDECDAFKKSDLFDAFPEYGLLDSVSDIVYSFADIQSGIDTLLGEISPLPLDGESEIAYHKGIHLCVDNCQARKYAEEGTVLRIIYPNNDQIEKIGAAPIFIVIGGNTLSRGLTIEGLTCSYFTRNSTQADTLMQMARWFGYRKGFELLQRIWMSSDVLSKFRLLAKIDMDLKRELRDFMEKGISPERYGPRIRNLPSVAKLRITAKNKSQSAIEDEDSFDFSGLSHETTKFDNDESLQKNINATELFLKSLSEGTVSAVSKNAIVWNDIPSSRIKHFLLEEYSISRNSGLIVDIPIFLMWLEKVNAESKFLHWNVAVAGDTKNQKRWEISAGVSVGCIERSRKVEERFIDIGSLRSGQDVLCDVQSSTLTFEQQTMLSEALKSRKNLILARARLNLSDTPLLLIYRIDKDGGTISKCRRALSAKADIIGISVIVPGDTDGRGYAKYIRVNISD